MSNSIIVNLIYYENTIYVSDAKPILEPHHFVCAIEESEIALTSSDIQNSKFRHCFRCLLCIFCLSIVCFFFFIFVGGEILFF